METIGDVINLAVEHPIISVMIVGVICVTIFGVAALIVGGSIYKQIILLNQKPSIITAYGNATRKSSGDGKLLKWFAVVFTFLIN
jgi:hypothetical protein